jgi:hypothetical protein
MVVLKDHSAFIFRVKAVQAAWEGVCVISMENRGVGEPVGVVVIWTGQDLDVDVTSTKIQRKWRGHSRESVVSVWQQINADSVKSNSWYGI